MLAKWLDIIVVLAQAKSRVLESICTGIRERYKALNLPPELALPDPGAADVVADMTHPDQRAIGAAGRKVLAMFETISQFCQKAQQVILFFFCCCHCCTVAFDAMRGCLCCVAHHACHQACCCAVLQYLHDTLHLTVTSKSCAPSSACDATNSPASQDPSVTLLLLDARLYCMHVKSDHLESSQGQVPAHFWRVRCDMCLCVL